MRPPIVPVPGDDAVGRELGVEAVGERRVLDEAPRVDQAGDAVADEELALLGVLLVVLGGPSGFDAGQRVFQLLIERHGATRGLVAALSAKPVTDGRRAAQ